MNRHLGDSGPISIVPMNSGTSSTGHNLQRTSEFERPGPAEKSDECIWLPAATVKAAECAVEMRRRIAEKLPSPNSVYRLPGDAWLAPPILDRFLGDIPSHVLISWVHFNLYTPTVSNLWYIELPESNEGLLTFFKKDPFQKQNAVFALIPGTVDELAITQTAIALFAANGHETCTILRGFPTSISHRDNWRANTIAPWFGSKVVKALFGAAAASLWKAQNMPVLCDHLRRFPDPWERETAEIEYRRELTAGTTRAQATEFSDAAFHEWFELVTDPGHAETERRNYRAACECAQQMRDRWQSKQMGEGAPHNDSK